ncbi:MAG: methyltransferase [Desulfobacterales bacterium]|nr:MAG: methyltransferase [Desulfobacterales bacterium]
MEQKHVGIPEAMLIPLWARAVETKRAKPIIVDRMALKILSRIDYDFSRFEKAWLSQVGVSIRTMLIDKAVRNFVRRKPGCIIINLGSGLDTRHDRLKTEAIDDWYDLDLPEAIGLRKSFFSEGRKNRFIAKSLFDTSWLLDMDTRDKPVLIIAEELLMHFHESQLRPLFAKLAVELPGAEMILEMREPFRVGKSRDHTAARTIDTVPFPWGQKDSRELETWHENIRFIQEWNCFDYHRNRWKWFGLIGRLPLIRRKMRNRIVHLRFC